MKAKYVMLGFLTGAAVASISTLLYTPSSGKDLRKNILDNKESFQQISNELKVKIREMKDETITASQVSKEAVTLFIADVKSIIETWKESVEPHKNEIQIRIKEIENALGELEHVVAAPKSKEE